MNFLHQTAGYLYRSLGNRLSDCCIVFPNKRAGLFFSKELAGLIEKPLFSPQYKTISDLMQELSGWQQADPLYLLGVLHRIYCRCTKREEPFELFYPWGEMLLSDFDDIDKNLVDAGDLFRNLSDLKEIDSHFHYLTPSQLEAIRLFWNHFSEGEEGVVKQDFLQLWSQLHNIYSEFTQHLSQAGRCYPGMMYRRCAEQPHLIPNPLHSFETYLFVGFNVLSAAEKRLFHTLQAEQKALFFWEYDNYYIENNWHEAGFFMRTNLKEFPMPADFLYDPDQLSKPRLVRIVATPSTVGQAVKVAEILSTEITPECPLQQTAVVLPDEQLLFPLLDHLPDTISHVNITMGYPFASTPAFSLFGILASLQRNISDTQGEESFYYKDLLDVTAHPYIQKSEPEVTPLLRQYINQHNRVRATRAELLALTEKSPVPSLYALLLRRCNDLPSWIDCLLACTEWLLNTFGSSTDNRKPDEEEALDSGFDSEFLYLFYTALKRAASSLSELGLSMNPATFNQLFRKHLDTLRTPFQGEPLEGLQILGILETRVLSFENLIICSMNEGYLPKTTTPPSYIPYNLRKGFGLMTPEHQDAMYAYYFYRLLQGAKRVTLLYNPESGDSSGGEMSRFLSQLMYENLFKPSFETVHFKLLPAAEPQTEILRTPQIQEMLHRKYASPGSSGYLSPSSLTTWIQCRLKFGFGYVERLREQENVSEELDDAMFGTLLHKSMQTLYAPFVGTELTETLLEKLIANPNHLREQVDEAFASEFFHSPVEKTTKWITGRNLIIREVLLKCILQILEVDRKRAPFTLHALEMELTESRAVLSKPGWVVRIGGKIDRIDRFGHELRVIDYKSGKAELKFGGIEELFTGRQDRSPLFQILLYAGILGRKEPSFGPVSAGIFCIRSLFDETFDELPLLAKHPLHDYGIIGEEFESYLDRIIDEIFDSENHFSPTDDRRHCKYCLYKKICHR